MTDSYLNTTIIPAQPDTYGVVVSIFINGTPDWVQWDRYRIVAWVFNLDPEPENLPPVPITSQGPLCHLEPQSALTGLFAIEREDGTLEYAGAIWSREDIEAEVRCMRDKGWGKTTRAVADEECPF